MARYSVQLKHTATTMASLPSVRWRFSKRFNPEVVGILQGHGFTRSQAIGIASDSRVRTFTGRLRRGMTLFEMGVGTGAMNELKDRSLLMDDVPSTQSGPEIEHPQCLFPAALLLAGSVSSSPSQDHLSSSRVLRSGNVDPGKVQDDRLSKIREMLKSIRGYFADNRYGEAKDLVERTIETIMQAISNGTSLDDPLLSYYYAAKVMKRVLGGHQKMFREGAGKSSAQVLILDPKGEKVLVQRRGPFKRLFQDSLTVSANAKPEKNETEENAAALSVKKEVGIDIDPARFKRIGREKSFVNYLLSYDFYAFSADEEKKLEAAAEAIKKGQDIKQRVIYRYDKRKRCLSVYTIDPHISRDVMRSKADKISSETGTPFIYPVYDNDRNSLLVYRLNEAEEKAVLKKIDEKEKMKQRTLKDLGKSGDDKTLELVDSDSMQFEHWLKLRNDYLVDPVDFALDLSGPYFGNDRVWEEMGMKRPDVLNIDDIASGLVCVAGGKGSNTNILRKISCDNGDFLVPDSAIITTFVYEMLVLGDPAILRDIKLLDKTKDDNERRQISKRIQDRIIKIELPEKLKREIAEQFKRLGGDLAVRSSATVEDQKKVSAAGLADSKLHQITHENVCESVKAVWASLFEYGFVIERRTIGVSNVDAKMAVMLQKFIEPKAAGMVFSFYQGRPVYFISAQPGIGEGVAQGEGKSDNWQVGLLADLILKKTIKEKKYRYVKKESGDVRKEDIDSKDPSLSDDEVLAVARIAKKIHEKFRDNGLAEEIDIEYVVPLEGDVNTVVIVQARPKIKVIEMNEDDKLVMKVRTVDESRIPETMKVIDLSNEGDVAYPGAVSAKIHIDYSISARQVPPGCILVAQHTNNDYNSKFASLYGVVTTDGDITSHAGQHSYEKRIPCLVGAQGAFEQLEPYKGITVTFDSRKKRIYIGEVPIVVEEIRLDVWVPDAKTVEENMGKVESAEAFRSWEESKRARPFVFFEDFEGHWRRRSGPYKYFQVDYYYKAWDKLTEILENMFKGRAPWELRTQHRLIKGRALFQEVIENDPRSIAYYVMGSKDISINDYQALFDARWEGFRRFSEFMSSLSEIKPLNVEGLVDNIILIFVWMHFGFWLDTIIGKAANDQMKYVSRILHNNLRMRAINDLPREKSVAPLRKDVPAGKVLHITINKDKEIYSVLEMIRSGPGLMKIFAGNEVKTIVEQLRKECPVLFGIIDGWSMKYKLSKEHLDILSDTDGYIDDLKKRIDSGNYFDEEKIIGMLEWYMTINGSPKSDISEIVKADPALLLVVKGVARLQCARSKYPDFHSKDKNDAARAAALADISEEEINLRMPEVLKNIKAHIEEDNKLEKSVDNMFRAYPELKSLCALYKMQLALREDGHHLIVPLQRKLARIMLDTGRAFTPAVFSKPEEIFDISTDELIALMKEPDATYIKLTFKRHKILSDAEAKMASKWSMTNGDLANIEKKKDILRGLLAQGYLSDALNDNILSIQDKLFAITDWRQLDIHYEYEIDEQKKEVFRATDRQKEEVFRIYRNRVMELEGAIAEYERVVKSACDILDIQIVSSSIKRVKDGYSNEKKMIMERVESLKSKMEVLKKKLNLD